MILDGVARPGKDPRGRPTSDRYRLSANRDIEMIRELKLPSGKSGRLIELRQLGKEPDTLVSRLEVFVDGEERAYVTPR